MSEANKTQVESWITCPRCEGDGLSSGPPECRPCSTCGGKGKIPNVIKPGEKPTADREAPPKEFVEAYGSANKKQVGGDHYRQAEAAQGEQHWDRMWRLHGRGYFIGQITRYIERYHLKNGLQDLQKAQHYIEKLTELETAWANGTGPAPGTTGSAPLPVVMCVDPAVPGGDRTVKSIVLDSGVGRMCEVLPRTFAAEQERAKSIVQQSPKTVDIRWSSDMTREEVAAAINRARHLTGLKQAEDNPQSCRHEYDLFSNVKTGNVYEFCVNCGHKRFPNQAE